MHQAPCGCVAIGVGFLSSGLYIALMVGVIILMTVITVPFVFFKKCPSCSVRNGLDATECKKCNTAFSED